MSLPVHTTTALKRWSCQDKELPAVDRIKALHVYDFDNTLFASPLPNRQVWASQTIGQLQSPDVFVNGGWWHDANILASTGEGVDKEERRAWAGWWNELIVELVQFSMQQKDALAVLLTGRSEANFADIIKRICRSKKLEFDMVCLKPSVGPSNQRFSSTMGFKQALLSDMVHTYKEAEEIRVYEDRVQHVKGFREFFTDFNKALHMPDPSMQRKPITAEVVHVAENATLLDPVSEVAEIQRLINSHNIAVKSGNAPGQSPRQIAKTVLFTGYMIPGSASEKLKQLAKLPTNVPEGEIRYLADNILISPRPVPRGMLNQIGGMGKTVTWRVVGTTVFENKVWAARVEPVSSTERYHSENPTPTVVLALRRGARPIDASRIQNWQPVPPEQAFEFKTTIGEKVLLRIEGERANDDEGRPPRHGKNGVSKHAREDDVVQVPGPPNLRPNGFRNQGGGTSNHHYRGGNHSRGRGGRPGPPSRGRGGGGGGYARGGGASGRGRGRGGGGYGQQYRSLDDMADHRGGGYRDYDDAGGRSRHTGGHDGAQDEDLYDAY